MVSIEKNIVAVLLSIGCSLLVLSTLQAQDAKIVADNLEFSREFYSGVHFSAIAESAPSFGAKLKTASTSLTQPSSFRATCGSTVRPDSPQSSDLSHGFPRCLRANVP